MSAAVVGVPPMRRGEHAADEYDIAQPPSAYDRSIDLIFRRTTMALSCLTVLVVLYVVADIAWVAMPAIKAYGSSFITSTTWDANRSQFGILPAIIGTL
jgi:phosphate transport system permease protein